MNTPTKKIFNIVTIIFSNNGCNTSIEFSLDDYMKLCDPKDKKEARKQVNSALEVLFNISIFYDYSKNKNRSKNYMEMRVLSTTKALRIVLCTFTLLRASPKCSPNVQ